MPYSTEISFRFLMASEEYGDSWFECNYSDVFAFFLTHPDGTVSNLAVLPGTTTPVLVTTVHPDNSDCSGANPQFFAQYVADGSGPIEYNGYTRSFTAMSPVIPGETYTIKLGIADAGDSMYDSAVFLEAGSFNLDLDLGDDYTISSGLAKCIGETVTLNTNNPSAEHVWQKDGVVISGATGSTLNVVDPGTYSVEMTVNGSCQTTDEIVVEFITPPVANAASDLFTCVSTSSADFTLTDNDAIILNTQDPTQYIVSYHLNQSDADNDVSPLSSPYTNTSNPQTIVARIDHVTGDCYDTVSFELEIASLPEVITMSPFEVCDDDYDGITSFDLSLKDTEALNGQTGMSVSYHATQVDAESDVMALGIPFNSGSTTVYVRLNNDTTGCYATMPLNLEVLAKPAVVTLTPMALCDDDYDGITSFDLSLKDTEALNGQTGMSVSYHATQADAASDVMALGIPFNSGSTTVYVRLNNDTTGCYATMPLNLEVLAKPVIPVISDYSICDYNNPGDGIETFDFTTKDTEIINGQNVSVSYYLTPEDADTSTNAVIGLFDNTSTPQTIYIRVEDNVTGCYNTGSFEIVVYELPQLQNAILVQCDEDGTPDGFTVYNLNEANENITVGGDTTGFTYTYFHTQADAQNNVNVQSPLPFINTVNPQTLYARVENDLTGCLSYAEVTLDVTATAIGNAGLETCDDDYDGYAEFTLSDANADILQNLPSGLDVAFYATLIDAQLEQNQLPDQYTNTTANSQTIFIRVENNNDCFGIANMTITVHPLPAFNDVVDQELCSTIPDQSTIDLSVYNSTILGTQNAADFTITYHESQADADSGQNPIIGNFTNQSNPDMIYVRVEDNATQCFITSISFELIFFSEPSFTAPTDYELCDAVPIDNSETFDLSTKIDEITGGDAQTSLSFHLTPADAENSVNPLPLTYTNIQNPQTLYVRVEDENTPTTGCYSLTTLDLVVNQAPAAFTPTSLIYCDADNDGFGTFTLSDATDQITSGDTTLVVTYHETLSNAENSANALLSPYDNIVQDLQTVYARVESSLITTGCATIVSFDLIVNPTPQLTDPTPLTQCDTDTDGFEPFNLNDKSTEILNGLDPLQYVLSFYLTQLDADSATNAISAPGFFTNTIANNQTIWVRVEDTSNGCYKLTSLELIVYALPVLVQPDPLELCDDAIADGLTVFDLTQSNNQITGGNGALEVLYYETESDAISGTNAIDPETSYTNTSISGAAANPQTVFVGVTDPVTGCVSYTTLTLRVLPNPTPGLTPEDIELCDENNPGDGIEVFDLTENEIYILNGESGVALTYYESEFDAQESQNAIVDPTQYSNTISPQTIYVRDTNIVTGCYSIVSFDLLVDPLPESTTITDYIVCELNTDQLYGFDLISKDVEILNGQDPSVFTVSYYATQGDAAAATNALLSPYNNTSNPQAIYVVITNTQTMCTVGGMSFAIEVQESAQANPDLQPLTYVICDQTDANDGFAAFDLSTMNAQVLDGQNTANYVVSYYGSQSDADAGINALDNIYQNISNPQTIYARVSNVSTTTSVCYATAPLELEVNLLPIFDLEDSYLLCENTNGTEVVGPPMMDTGLSSADYSFEWQFNSGVIAGATASSYTATQAGTYSVTVTNLTTLCDNTVQTTVISSEPPILTAEVTSMVFADNATVEATVVGNGNYELSIDNGPWTTDTIFTGLSDGIHQIWARDITGCGEVMVEVLVIGYPLFFTPNGDGYNDTWNIFSLSDQLETKIYIFDRYGKLLKEIRPQGRGWDGTYNGALMPSSDYWFTVHYLDLSTNKIKQHKAHFTLKR